MSGYQHNKRINEREFFVLSRREGHSLLQAKRGIVVGHSSIKKIIKLLTIYRKALFWTLAVEEVRKVITSMTIMIHLTLTFIYIQQMIVLCSFISEINKLELIYHYFQLYNNQYNLLISLLKLKELSYFCVIMNIGGSL